MHLIYMQIRVLPESPRWLLAQNRMEEAEKEIRKMASINQRTLPPDYFNQFKVGYYIFLHSINFL